MTSGMALFQPEPLSSLYKVMAKIVGVVVQQDYNGDFSLNKNEMEMLIMRLKAINGIEFNEEHFRANVKTPMTLGDTLKVLKNLTDDSVPAEDNIFTIHSDKLGS